MVLSHCVGHSVYAEFFPYLLDDIESIDVDTEFDFMIAEMLYEKMRVKWKI